MPNDIQSIIGNLSGARPVDPLGDIAHYLRNLNWNPASGFSHGSLQAPPYKMVPVPKNAAGETPWEYAPSPNNDIEKLLGNAQPGEGLLGLNVPTKALEHGLTDDEFQTLQRESADGNKLAIQLLGEYHPKYGLTSTQYEQKLVQPLVSDIEQLPSEFGALEGQQAQINESYAQALPQVQSIAEQYSGISPQAPNAQTSAIAADYGNIASTAGAAMTPIMTAALKDLGTAAEISLRTFPYTTLISDLLNRYAYQLESPSYPAPPINIPGVPDSIKKLFTAATGSQLAGLGLGNAASTIGTPDASGITTPALQPATNPTQPG